MDQNDYIIDSTAVAVYDDDKFIGVESDSTVQQMILQKNKENTRPLNEVIISGQKRTYIVDGNGEIWYGDSTDTHRQLIAAQDDQNRESILLSINGANAPQPEEHFTYQGKTYYLDKKGKLREYRQGFLRRDPEVQPSDSLNAERMIIENDIALIRSSAAAGDSSDQATDTADSTEVNVDSLTTAEGDSLSQDDDEDQPQQSEQATGKPWHSSPAVRIGGGAVALLAILAFLMRGRLRRSRSQESGQLRDLRDSQHGVDTIVHDEQDDETEIEAIARLEREKAAIMDALISRGTGNKP
ncbi:MAG: hypothetical protein V1735_04190 [Nanoarchaeota archaeon]